MKKLVLWSLALLSIFSLNSCTEEYYISKDIEGLWDIAVYQKIVYKNLEIDYEESGSFQNKGKMEFTSNGKGYYNVLEDLGPGVYFGSAEFTWTNTATEIHVTSNNINKIFTILSSSDESFELEREVADFYFSGGEPGQDYKLYERIVLEK